MKLNNRGWGLGVFLGFVALLLCCLLVAGVNAYKLGISTESNLQFNNSTIDKNTNTDFENEVLNAAMNYKRNEYGNISSGQTVIVKISRLVDEKYLSSNNYCSGYVQIRNQNGDEKYNVYLKCSDYVTDGYDSEYDD